MRSALDVRICHLLRVMRVVAPVEWNLGLPFPSNAATAHVERAVELPEELSFTRWLEIRTRRPRPAACEGVARPLAA